MTMATPNALVLGGGGLLGEAWTMGLLSGLEDAAGLDMRRCAHFVGTSAGAVVAAHLAGGNALRRPPADNTSSESQPGGAGHSAAVTRSMPPGRANRTTWLSSAATLPLVLALASSRGATARAMLLRRLPAADGKVDGLLGQVAHTAEAFDGRLRVVAVDRQTGRRVVFGSPGAPPATVAEAVAASCTVPWRFVPVTIDGRQYVDGAVWSATNLDVTPGGRGSHVLCLNPIAALRGGGAVDMFRRLACSAAWLETRRLRRRGVTVQMVAPDSQSARAMGPKLMDRRRADAVLRAGYRQGVVLAGSSTIDAASQEISSGAGDSVWLDKGMGHATVMPRVPSWGEQSGGS
jgi:NTE family protein